MYLFAGPVGWNVTVRRAFIKAWKTTGHTAEQQKHCHGWWYSHLPQKQLDTASPPPGSCGMKCQHCWGHWLLIQKKTKKKKRGQACHIDATSRRKPSQGCWLPSISSDSPYNEHVISSRFQLEQDTNRDSCMLKCLHLRIPRRYQMRRWLRQTRLVPWQSAAGHGLELTWESICCAYHWKESGDLMIWEFRLDERSRG